MKFLLFVLTVFTLAAQAEPLTVIGLVPGQYVDAKLKNKYQLVSIEMDDRIIKSIKKITAAEISKFSEQPNTVILKSGKTYDVIYPGLINLHNHTKQNNISVWDLARGQFSNRFEWRGWGLYTSSVSANMNPWIDYGSAMTCAAFRWSELQAMVLGTTYLQGPSSCISNYSIHQVEDPNAYISKKDSVRAPTDLVLPNEMTFVWNTLRPIMEAKKVSYEEALKETIEQYCPEFKNQNLLANGVNDDAALKIFEDQDKLKELCGVKSAEDKDKFPPQFIRYVYWVHGGIAKRKKYLDNPNHGAIIVHLAEGRQDDPYNQMEYKLVQLLGLNRPQVNFIHAVGLNDVEFADMAKNQMGIVWSPFSNLLLYGQTLDVKTAMRTGVTVSLGSDWTPTGSRSVLEELKIARAYVQKCAKPTLEPGCSGNTSGITDEDLYKMVTQNPAKMINHFEEKGVSADGQDHSVGTIAPGAMASLMVVSLQDKNPYTNLLIADEKTVNLVIVDGRAIYGNENYIKDQLKKSDYEILSNHLVGVNKLDYHNFSVAGSKDPDIELGKKISSLDLETQDLCKFPIRKVFVNQNSREAAVTTYQSQTNLNLDRFSDIQKLLGAAVMTQPRNLIEPEHSAAKPEYVSKYFPSLYSCNDPVYLERLNAFVSKEIDENAIGRNAKRKSQGLGAIPAKMAKDYGK